MAKQASNKPDYGNWVSKHLIYMFAILGVAFSALTFLVWVLAVAAVLCFAVAFYFLYARYLFSVAGGNVQGQIWETVVSNLDWNGDCQALDICCGNAALTIKLASKFTKAQVTGIDYWGKRWEYSKNVCEANAKAEGVDDRVAFQKASAVKLPFEDGYFDAAVSNLCFHEVGDAKDKRELIREALRVVKKGGKSLSKIFSFSSKSTVNLTSWLQP